ncbi:MAG: sodium:alanine symporter family protein, partial [Coriobacteriales bacterium]|nr:sodium:alanine symporter family protein [Coriobacteriales bacterium]
MDAFIEGLGSVIGTVDGWLWSWPLIIVLVGTHLYMTIRTGFIQRKIGTAIKLSFKKDENAEGNISQFGALTTALSATIGTGNIVGVATAVVFGGVGAILWMWLIGILGIATKYAETYISVKYRVKDHKGDMLGGAMYALERGFPGKKWAKITAICFAAFAALASFGIGAAVQSNSVTGIINQYAPGIPMWVVGLVIAGFVALVVFGGIKSISRVCEKIVPFMAIFYVLCCIIIIGMNGAYLGAALKWIVVCAFTPKAMVGGGAGFA